MSEHSKLPYIVEEAYTDNGMVSHYNIIDKHGLRVAQSEHKCHAKLLVDSVNGVKGYREALKFYADESNWAHGELLDYNVNPWDIAKNALKADNQ